MRDFIHEFKERIRKVNTGETKTPTMPLKPPQMPVETVKDDAKARYRIVARTLPYGIDKPIVFGLSLLEAKALLLWPRFWTKAVGETESGQVIWRYYDMEVML